MASERVAKAVAARLGRINNGGGSGTAPVARGRIVTTGLHVLDVVTQAPVCLGSLVEVVGPSSAGKTKALHAVAAHAIITRPRREGLARICWFDLNDALDVPLIENLLRQSLGDKADHLVSAALRSMLIYKPDSTAAMIESIRQLPAFLRSPQGNDVDTVIVDALGSFHYVDKYESEQLSKKGELPIDIMLVDATRQLLATNKVAVFVSKCALFESERLAVAWPFRNAGVPECPRDIMPEAWKRIVSHVLLLYYIETADDATCDHISRRGVVAMAYGQTNHAGSRQLNVHSASVMHIMTGVVACQIDQTTTVQCRK